jgi:hypothetical protein
MMFGHVFRLYMDKLINELNCMDESWQLEKKKTSIMEVCMRIKSTHVDEINNVENFGHVNETIFMD